MTLPRAVISKLVTARQRAQDYARPNKVNGERRGAELQMCSRKFIREGLLILVLALSTSPRAKGDPLDRWVWRSPKPFAGEIYSLINGNGVWLATGNTGVLATSPDGANWDLACVWTNSILRSGAYGNGRFVVGSSRGPIVSYDGHTWSKPATNVSFYDINFANGLFLGVNGSDETIWRSIDGFTWTSQAVGFWEAYFWSSFVNGHYFVLGFDTFFRYYVLCSSTNGSTWSAPVNLGTNGIDKIAFGNGRYVGIYQYLNGYGTYSHVRTSLDGVIWSAPVQFTNREFSDVIFAQGRFLIIDVLGSVWTSTDGNNWIQRDLPELYWAKKIAWDGSMYLVACYSGAFFSSKDGLQWERKTVGSSSTLNAVIYTNGLFAAVGGQAPDDWDLVSSSIAATSTNGRDWTSHYPGTTNGLYAITHAANRYVASGANGTIVTSPDAIQWTAVSSSVTNSLYAVAYGAGRYVAVGGISNRATIVSAPDGVNWIEQQGATNYFPLRGLVYGQNQFVAVGYTNGSKRAATLTSFDGLNWTQQTSSATDHLLAITYANGLYVAVGYTGLAISPDGVAWTNPLVIPVRQLRAVTFGSGWFVAPAYQGGLYASTNGFDWSFRKSFDLVSRNPTFGIAFGDDSFIAVGLMGQVLESGLFHPPPPVVEMGISRTDRRFVSFTGAELHGYEIQKSESLTGVWEPLFTVTNLSARTTIPDVSATNSAMRFYRAKLLD
jgi:hypothetical protein